MLTRRSLMLPSGRISYLERGCAETGRPSFILVHGLVGTAATLALLMEAFPADWHAVAIDLPGAGFSDRDPHLNPGLAAMAQCVHQTLDALAISTPVLVGYSHGGAVALYVAASAPARIRALVLLAPAHPYFSQADRLIAFYLSPIGGLFAHTLPWYPEACYRLGLRLVSGAGGADLRERVLPYRQNLRTPGTVSFLLRLLATWHADMDELRHLLERSLVTSALLLWGDRDRVVPASSAPALTKRLQDAELHLLPGVGHRPAEEDPAQCVALITDWWTRQSVPRKPPVSAGG